MIREQARSTISGWFVVAIALVLLLAGAAGLYVSAQADLPRQAVASALLLPVAIFLLLGLFTREPERGERAAALRRLRGTVQGARPAVGQPVLTKRRLSLRVRNFESAQAEGERQRRQPDRDRGHRRVARRRHGRGRVRGGQLRELRPGPERVGAAQPGDAATPTTRHDDEVSLRGGTQAVCRRAEARDPGAARQGRRGGDRGAHQPSRLRAGDRRRDAAPPAGRGHHRRAPEDRRRRRRHGGDGAATCSRGATRSRSTRSARRRW